MLFLGIENINETKQKVADLQKEVPTMDQARENTAKGLQGGEIIAQRSFKGGTKATKAPAPEKDKTKPSEKGTFGSKELSSDEISKITEELTKNFNSKIKLNYKHDESLIGGLVVQVGSTMVDTSIRNKLQQIENRMIEA